MNRRGVSYLPLHYGKPPENLYKKIVILTGQICTLISEVYSTQDLIRRFSDPVWFHSLSLVTGFDWNSSGTTTTTIHALKEYANNHDLDFFVAGGKGKNMKLKNGEIEERSPSMISSNLAGKIARESDYIARVDSNLLQDGFDLYIHSLISDYRGNYAVVQQGLNDSQKLARRYHWTNISMDSVFEEQREGIGSNTMGEDTLDLSSPINRKVRENMLRVMREKPKISGEGQTSLDSFFEPKVLNLKVKVPFERLKKIYEYDPSNMAELLSIPGAGKSTIRAIAYISEVLTGEQISMQDPVRYSYALGGKDGIPKPVNYDDYDRSIEFFGNLLRQGGMQAMEREKILKRLSRERVNSGSSYTVKS